jgi:hypothetical protein
MSRTGPRSGVEIGDRLVDADEPNLPADDRDLERLVRPKDLRIIPRACRQTVFSVRDALEYDVHLVRLQQDLARFHVPPWSRNSGAGASNWPGHIGAHHSGDAFGTGGIEGGYDGHTLTTVVPAMQALLGNVLDRIIADAGYRGHNAPAEHKFRVYTAGQKRRVNQQIKREFKRRAAIEPVWTSQGRSPHGPQLPRPLKRRCINATLAAVGYNFRRLIQWLRILMIRIATSFAVQLQSA